jgi:hypothetical protein
VELGEMMEDAFRRGRTVGQREGQVFQGVPAVPGVTRGATWSFERSWLASHIDYERAVTAQLRHVQHLRHDRWRAERAVGFPPRTLAGRIARSELGNSIRRRRRPGALLSDVQELVEDELWRVRWAVDEELERVGAPDIVVRAIRWPPVRPAGVREIDRVETFLDQDARRGPHQQTGRRDAGGWDFGLRWNLENPLARWEITAWRISWLANSTREVYAIEHRGQDTGRVWLIGVVSDEDRLRETMDVVQPAMRERNSLVVAATALRSISR